MIIASPSVPHTRDFASMSIEFTGKLFTGNKEYVSNMSLFVSISNQGDAACCVPDWVLSIFGKGSALSLADARISVAGAIEAPSQYHAEPSSEQVNTCSGYTVWNFTSQTKMKQSFNFLKAKFLIKQLTLKYS